MDGTHDHFLVADVDTIEYSKSEVQWTGHCGEFFKSAANQHGRDVSSRKGDFKLWEFYRTRSRGRSRIFSLAARGKRGKR